MGHHAVAHRAQQVLAAVGPLAHDLLDVAAQPVAVLRREVLAGHDHDRDRASPRADVLISYLDEGEDARETLRVVQDAGHKAIAVAGDISEEAHCQQLVQRAVQEFGKLDILVNNAAFQRTYQSITEISAEELQYTFATNIFALFYLCKAAAPHLKEGATIINTSSVEAFQPEPSLLAYAATRPPS